MGIPGLFAVNRITENGTPWDIESLLNKLITAQVIATRNNDSRAAAD